MFGAVSRRVFVLSLLTFVPGCSDSDTAPETGGDDLHCTVEGEVDFDELGCDCDTTIERRRTCTEGQWSTWTFDSSCEAACNCEPGDVIDTRELPCGSGCASGVIQEEHRCGDSGVAAWHATTECVLAAVECTEGQSETRTVGGSCDELEQTRTCDDATCTYGAWLPDDVPLCEGIAPREGEVFCPGETITVPCDADGNDTVFTCDAATLTFIESHTVYGCTATSSPGAGTRVCPGNTFTRSCWPIANGHARVDWECEGTLDAGGGGFTVVDEDYCTATSGPEAGQHFCPGEVILRDNCPGARNYYTCPDTQLEGDSFVSEATLSCNVEAKEWEPQHRGVDLMRWQENGSRFRAIRTDLCDTSIRVKATAYADRGQRTSNWANGQSRMIAAINGGFYGGGFAPDGCVAFGNGVEWPNSGDTNYRSFIAFGPNEGYISQAPTVDTPPYPGFGWMEEAVCGDATIVLGGVAQTTGATGPDARTGVGFSGDRRTLYFLTVDEVSSTGLSVNAFAPYMAALGVDFAINLDGGGSTTAWTKSLGVVNTPSDGSERTVSNHLGIQLEGGNAGYNCVP